MCRHVQVCDADCALERLTPRHASSILSAMLQKTSSKRKHLRPKLLRPSFSSSGSSDGSLSNHKGVHMHGKQPFVPLRALHACEVNHICCSCLWSSVDSLKLCPSNSFLILVEANQVPIFHSLVSYCGPCSSDFHPLAYTAVLHVK